MAQLHFLENNGQVTDQYHHPRADIDFMLRGEGLTLFINSGNMYYQFSEQAGNDISLTNIDDRMQALQAKPVEMYRMEVELVGANKEASHYTEKPSCSFERYYLPHCGENGIVALGYERIVYREVYPGIDWVLYIKDGKVEYDFIIKEGADPSVIRLKYKGAESLLANADGSLTAACPLGTITQSKPWSYQEDGGYVASSWKVSGKKVGFQLGNYKGRLTIDPTLAWGTYYRGSSPSTNFLSITKDGPARIYACGFTTATDIVATVGTYRSVYSGGAHDAFIARFDTLGNRLWGTYLGGFHSDAFNSIATDAAGNIYVSGSTSSDTGIASTGCHQPLYQGSNDGILAKFNESGQRGWSTYYGGIGSEIIYSVNIDIAGRLIASGKTSSPNNIATVNTQQPVYGGGTSDAFLVRFDTAGNRLWGTYYGGMGNEDAYGCTSDGLGNIYIAGVTNSSTGIASTGSHQDSFVGIEGNSIDDAYLAKFDSSGNRLWGTYYGGENREWYASVICDKSNNVYLAATTGFISGNTPAPSTFNIASTGAYQQQPSDSAEIFLAKFSPGGNRLWGTYYGSTGRDYIASYGNGLATDAWNNIYVCGMSTSAGMSTSSAFQQQQGGDFDILISSFDSSGNRLWATYYGGAGNDQARGCVHDGDNSLYIAGFTGSDNNIVTVGAFQSTRDGGVNTAFISRIGDETLNTVHLTPRMDDLVVYPNPNNGTVFVECYAVDVNYQVADITGRVVKRGRLKGDDKRISITELQPGVYVLTIEGRSIELLKR
ncbi:MAG: SBBP repeat-containing protein [Flavipsychrobacter sp.]|nr:SBBP repeat-containing protein [Flavipsychrobacter sp.]